MNRTVFPIKCDMSLGHNGPPLTSTRCTADHQTELDTLLDILLAAEHLEYLLLVAISSIKSHCGSSDAMTSSQKLPWAKWRMLEMLPTSIRVEGHGNAPLKTS